MPVEVIVPPLGGTTDTLTLIAWYKQDGDRVEKDDLLFAVETDKATLDIESPASGILRQVSAEPGAEVASLARIAVIIAPDEDERSSAISKEIANGQSTTKPYPAKPTASTSVTKRNA